MKVNLLERLKKFEWLAAIFFLLSLYQIMAGSGEYISIWLKRALKNYNLSGTERSALFLLGGTGAKFMELIDVHTPLDKNVVVPERSAVFSQQNTLSYFLAPRSVVTCGCGEQGNRCFSCLRVAENAVPVTANFPPPDFTTAEKPFVPFDTAVSDYYLGLYVSPGWQSQKNDRPNRELPLGIAALLDIIVWLAWLFLGLLLLRWINPGLEWPDRLILAILIGLGFHTWMIFLASWAGIPLTIWTVGGAYLVLALAGWFGGWKQHAKREIFKFERPEWKTFLAGLKTDFFRNLILVGIVSLFAIATVISLVRSYSLYDDLAIWSLKGRAIAQEGTIFAARETSGHGLAYPLNVSLVVTVFRLLDGDALPGSKILFPLSLFVVVFSLYRFWRRWNVSLNTALAGVFFVASIPVVFFHATLGYANLTFTCYLVLGALWSIRGLSAGNRRELLLAGVLFALAGWTRPEGALFAGVLMLALWIPQWWSRAKKDWLLYVYWVAPVMLPLSWLFFAADDIRQDQAGGALQAVSVQLQLGRFTFDALKATALFGWQQLLQVSTWGVLLPLTVVAILLSYRLFKKRNTLPGIASLPLVTVFCILIPFGLFLVESASEKDFNTFLTVSFDRAFFSAALMMLFWIVLVTGSGSTVQDSRSCDA